MAVRQYIGARYVPKFYEGSNGTEWDSNTSYEALTIVTYLSNSYTSKKPVPAAIGNPMQNPEYWASTGNYNAQVEEYRQITQQCVDDVAEIHGEVEGLSETVSGLGTTVEGLSGTVGDLSDDVGELSTTVTTEIVPSVEKLKDENDLEVYGVLRPTQDGWIALNDTHHKSKNIQSITIEGNSLVVHHDIGAAFVGTMIVAPDETFARFNMSVGSSVDADKTTIEMFGSPLIGGRFSGTGTSITPTAGYNSNVSGAVWNTNHWEISIGSILKPIFKVIGGTVTEATGNTNHYEYMTTLEDGKLDVYPIDPSTHTYTVPAGTVRFDVSILVDTHMSPQAMVDNYALFSTCNLWVYGKLLPEVQ